MRNLYIFLLFCCFHFPASAQKVYFIYLQSDNGTPFYVKTMDQIYSSAHPGYLIWSNLVDSTYQFSVGFSASRKEAKFIVPLGARDRGFLIKEFDYGIGLFDLQTLSVIRPQINEAKKTSYEYRTDDFTALLAKAANDTTLFYVPIFAKEDVAVQTQAPKNAVEKNPEQAIAVMEKTDPPHGNTDTSASHTPPREVPETKKPELTTGRTEPDTSTKSQENSTGTVTTMVPQKDSILITDEKKPLTGDAAAEPYVKSVIKKYAESATVEGHGLIYFDQYQGGVDTIRLIIPNPPMVHQQVDSVKVETTAAPPPVIAPDTVQQKIVVAVRPAASQKAKCPSIASNNDFFRLRKNMAAKANDEAMMVEAIRSFRSKCFSTEQLRNLSALFLTSSGKYHFFDAAYGHVSDPQNFADLESEIKEAYFIERFKALLSE